MISTRGRYSVRVLLDLAEHRNGGDIPMKEVAARQEISLKYLERIMPLLTQAGLVEGVHGKGGGYRLCREPEDYSIGEILHITEGDMAPVACLECGAAPCHRAAFCKTLPMWKRYQELTDEYFHSISLWDLLQTEVQGDYVI